MSGSCIHPTADLPNLILIGGDGGFSGVPTYIAQTQRALCDRARIAVMSDINRGGYNGIIERGGEHLELPGLRSSLNPFLWIGTARRLAARLKATPDAVIWAHARMAVLLVRFLMAGGGLPPTQRVIVTYHGLPFDPGHRRSLARVSRWIERSALKHCPPHDLVFLSCAARERFRTTIGPALCDRHRLSVLNNCSDLGPLPDPPPDTLDRNIVMTGRAGYQKNIEAAALIFAHLPDNYRLILCGMGTDTAKMKARFGRILNREALARVTFMGPVADIREILSTACAYMMTSRYEGMPIGALEAFEAGLPLALSDILGTAEIRDAHPMTLTLRFKDPAAEAAALDTMVTAYLTDREETSAKVRHCWAGQFSYEQWALKMHRLWDRVQRPL